MTSKDFKDKTERLSRNILLKYNNTTLSLTIHV